MPAAVRSPISHRKLSKYGDISRRAFDHWIRTLRWKADNWRIGLPEVYGAETGWSTYLQVKETQKMVWVGTQIFAVPAEKAVTPTIWHETSACMIRRHFRQ